MDKYTLLELSLLACSSIGILWIFRRKLKTSNYYFFMIVNVFSIITNIVDAFFLSAYSNKIFKSEITYHVIIKFYIILLIVYSLTIIWYMSIKVLEGSNKNHYDNVFKYIVRCLFLTAAIDIVVIVLLPLSISIAENGGIMVEGDALAAAFFIVLIYLVVIISVLIIFRDKTNRWTKICFSLAVLIWVIDFIIFYITHLPGIFGFGDALIILIMFLIVENPINKLDTETGCFLDSYLYLYIDDLINKGETYCFTILNLESKRKSIQNDETIKKCRERLIKDILKDRSNVCFISSYSEITVITKNTSSLNKVINNFIDKTSLLTDVKAKCIYFDMIDEKFIDLEEYENIVETAKAKANNTSEDFVKFKIDINLINEIRNEKYVVEEINKALDEKRIIAYIQPLYSVEKKRIVAAESLTRLIKKDGTVMAPYQYIPVAEKSNLIVKIGEKMFENACEILTNKKFNSFELSYIDVNLSIIECEQENLADNLITIAQKYRIDPKRINFEITESGSVKSIKPIIKNIERLTDYGFGFSLDDFGSGKSNINYLFEMPVLYIKLDAHLIWKYYEDERANKTVKTIIKLSHDLGLKVVAEGVETKEQFEELIEQGVDLIQGYYFFKPMPPEEYLKLIEKENK